jgi:hypothetical protein
MGDGQEASHRIASHRLINTHNTLARRIQKKQQIRPEQQQHARRQAAAAAARRRRARQ